MPIWKSRLYRVTNQGKENEDSCTVKLNKITAFICKPLISNVYAPLPVINHNHGRMEGASTPMADQKGPPSG